MGVSLFRLIAIFVAVSIIHCQTVCNRQMSLEWHLKQHTVQMHWTLIGNICRSVAQCWGESQGEDESSGRPFNFPQLCPLQLQHGDKLLMSADETLKSYGIRLLNVSKHNFESCSTNGQIKDQFLFPHNINESAQVEAKWLTPGRHYFIALHEGDTQLCKLGLRLNVSVKTQLCQVSPLLRLCSGKGICQTDLWEGAYHCRCHHRYSGRFCEKFDACLDNPCENKGVCLSNGSTDPNHRTYKCLCPPHFTGKDKTHWSHLLSYLNLFELELDQKLLPHIWFLPLLYNEITVNQMLFDVLSNVCIKEVNLTRDTCHVCLFCILWLMLFIEFYSQISWG